MTRVKAALQAEALLGFPVQAFRLKNAVERNRRFMLGSKEKNVAWWADCFEKILAHLEKLKVEGKLPG